MKRINKFLDSPVPTPPMSQILGGMLFGAGLMFFNDFIESFVASILVFAIGFIFFTIYLFLLILNKARKQS